MSKYTTLLFLKVQWGLVNRTRSEFNGNPLFGFPMVFLFEQNGGHFVQNQWKSDLLSGNHIVT